MRAYVAVVKRLAHARSAFARAKSKDRITVKKTVRIVHRGSGDLIAEGPVGWGITPFEGNWYISARHLRTDGCRTTPLPGLCPYKFVYLWLHYSATNGEVAQYIGWRYVVPNPLLPFIAFRVAVPDNHPALDVTVTPASVVRTE
jgi:uncharacterized protein (DUF427 family)